MRKILIAVIMLLAFVVPVTANSDKVTICHVSERNPENAHTITISENALKAHLGENEEGLHGGDYRGACLVTSIPTPTPSMSVVPTPTPSVVPTTTPTPSVQPTPTDGPTLLPNTATTP